MDNADIISHNWVLCSNKIATEQSLQHLLQLCCPTSNALGPHCSIVGTYRRCSFIYLFILSFIIFIGRHWTRLISTWGDQSDDVIKSQIWAECQELAGIDQAIQDTLLKDQHQDWVGYARSSEYWLSMLILWCIGLLSGLRVLNIDACLN